MCVYIYIYICISAGPPCGGHQAVGGPSCFLIFSLEFLVSVCSFGFVLLSSLEFLVSGLWSLAVGKWLIGIVSPLLSPSLKKQRLAPHPGWSQTF